VRAYLPAYEMRTVRSLDEALALLASEPGAWRPFAGGTDLMVLLESGALPPSRYVNVWGLPELRGVHVSADWISIGALATYAQIRADATLRRECPLLGHAAAETGGPAIQNRGTLGGNIANASPAADSPPVLLVADAELELASVRGARRIPYASFHRGYKQMDLAADELVARVHLPRGRSHWRAWYRKVGTRRAQAISKVVFAGTADVADGEIQDIRLALGSVAPVPLRCTATEAVIRGRVLDPRVVSNAQEILAEEISPIDDLRSTAAYRRRVSLNLLGEFLRRIVSAAS
jgi:CO/xanthine dehydrogenase FAD-binding subunit